MNDQINKLKDLMGGRKLTLAVILTFISTLFVAFGLAEFSEWANFQIWLYGTFVFGNGVEHVSNALKRDKNE